MLECVRNTVHKSGLWVVHSGHELRRRNFLCFSCPCAVLGRSEADGLSWAAVLALVLDIFPILCGVRLWALLFGLIWVAQSSIIALFHLASNTSRRCEWLFQFIYSMLYCTEGLLRTMDDELPVVRPHFVPGLWWIRTNEMQLAWCRDESILMQAIKERKLMWSCDIGMSLRALS